MQRLTVGPLDLHVFLLLENNLEFIMKWWILLLLFFNTNFLSYSSNVLSRSASNLTCYGYSFFEYVCTWVPGSESIEYVARWQDEENEPGFWRDCTDARENACYFYGEISSSELKVTVQPKDEQGDSNLVETTLDIFNIIPLPPRNLIVVPGETAQQLYAQWKDSDGWTLINNQLIFRIRYREIDSVKWSITTNIEDHKHLIDDLDAFTKYAVQVQAMFFANDVYGDWSSPVYMTTREGAPSGSVSVLPLYEYKSESKDYKTYRDVLISWMDLPRHHHRGILLGYKIKLVGRIESSDDLEHFKVPANKTTLLIPGLKKRLNYTAYITAYNAVGATEPSTILIPVSDDNPESGNYFTYIIILVSVVMVLLLSHLFWLKIKKFKEQMEPLPEPHFFKLEIPDDQPTSKPLGEKETFDELKSKPKPNESEAFLKYTSTAEKVEHQQCSKAGIEDGEEISTYTVVEEYVPLSLILK